MAKAKPVKVAAPAPAPALVHETIATAFVAQLADAPPPPPAPPAKASKPAARVADFTRLAVVQGLPEVPKDADLEAIEFEPGSIEQFMASETDRRVMRVVGYAGGFASQEV